MTLAPSLEPWSFRHYQSTRCDEPTSLSNQAKGRTDAFCSPGRCSRPCAIQFLPPPTIRYHPSALNLRNPEVPAKMGKVQRTDRPGNQNQVDLIRPRQQQCDVADRIILE